MIDLTKLVEMSNKHGKNPDLVLAGGGGDLPCDGGPADLPIGREDLPGTEK